MTLSLVAAAAAAATALPSPIALPQYEGGDAFVFSDGRVERVVESRGDTVIWAGLSGPSYTRSRNFIVPVLAWRSGRGTGRREVHGNPDAIWPMARPRSVRFRVVSETRTSPEAALRRSVALWVCKSGKLRGFTVKAGSFEAVPVVCDRYSSTTMRLIERREWDYAPELGHYIRRVSINYLRGSKREVELVAALSGPAASPARLSALARQASADRDLPRRP
ncbi:hypothetical protein [Erythrobacter oryzae]|uniref:hypothetical protein n=1 Tax=Erythrobacter oryzae TaxID=3019556 RepID=UPI0025545AC1|nr:hypothetical protein [Erythrobacter sp. COR-2]